MIPSANSVGPGGSSTAPALDERRCGGAIVVEGLSRVFVRKGKRGRQIPFVAIQDVDLRVDDGQFFCLLGPTGCGKSTILRMIAGFVPATRGSITVHGRPVRRPGADRGVVFQGETSLFPWLTARENVEYGLRVRGVGRVERRRRAEEYLQVVGLAGRKDLFPRELSGGMKQRIQIARVLVNDPEILLMDEPFGALDAQTRSVLQTELQRIWDATRKTVLFITHDIEEAVLLGDRVAVMTAGPAARIKAIRDVTLPRPRSILAPEFLSLREQLRQDIEAEAIKAMGQATG